MTSSNESMDKLVAVDIVFHLPGGRKKLYDKEIGISQDDESRKVISLGSKKYINPEVIAPFTNRKNLVLSHAAYHSIAFSKFFLLPKDYFEREFIDFIEKQHAEFYKYKEWFIENYNTLVFEWSQKNPTWSEKILRSAPSQEYMENSIEFYYNPLEISGFKTSRTDLKGAKTEFNLFDQLLEEVSEESNSVFSNFIDGGRLSKKIIGPISRIIEKMEVLSFIDGRIEVIIQTLKEMRSKLESTDKYSPAESTMMLAVVNMLLDPANMMKVADGVKVDNLFNDDLESAVVINENREEKAKLMAEKENFF